MGPEEGSHVQVAERTQERERDFAWLCVQGLNVCLIIDKISEKDCWRGHISWMTEDGYSKVAFH
jgi:hypothetical protein